MKKAAGTTSSKDRSAVEYGGIAKASGRRWSIFRKSGHRFSAENATKSKTYSAFRFN
jgi:hypothetical protein